MFSGEDEFIATGGVKAFEKVTWSLSSDKKELRSTEYNHFETDPEGYWPKTFEFVLNKD